MFRPIAVIVLGFVVPISLIAGQITSQAYPAWPAAFALSVYTGARLAGLVVSGTQHLYGFAFFLYCYLFMGLAPLVQLSRGTFPSVAPWITRGDIPAAFALVALGITAFELGYFVQRRMKSSAQGSTTRLKSLPAIAMARPREAKLHPQRVYVLACVSLAISLAFIILVGPTTFLQSRNDVFASIGEGIGNASTATLLRGFVTGSLLVSFAGVIAMLRFRNSVRDVGLVTLAVVLGGVSLFVTNVVNSPRYLAIVVLVGMLSALGIFATRFRARVAYGSALAGFLYVFPILGGFRNSISFGAASRDVENVLLGGDYDSFAQIVNAVTYVLDNGIEFGRQLSGALLVWVPRAVWPDKPISTSTLVSEYMGYPFTNVSSPVWAELLIDFGVLGVVVGFFAAGMLLGRFDDRLVANLDAGRFPGLAAVVVPFYLIILLRGALLSTIPVLLVMVVCIAFVARGRSQLSVECEANRNRGAPLIRSSRLGPRS